MQAEHLPVHGQADYSLTSQEAKSFSDRDDEGGLTGLTLPIAVFGGLGEERQRKEKSRNVPSVEGAWAGV
jgi:hypothetical protein